MQTIKIILMLAMGSAAAVRRCRERVFQGRRVERIQPRVPSVPGVLDSRMTEQREL